MKKKKVLRVLTSNFKTYVRYSWVADKKQKKKILSVLNGKLLSSFVGGALVFINSLKGKICKNSLRNPVLNTQFFILSLKRLYHFSCLATKINSNRQEKFIRKSHALTSWK